MIAFYHYQDMYNKVLYVERSKIGSNPFLKGNDTYTVIHDKQVGYANLQFKDPKDKSQTNENFYELFKFFRFKLRYTKKIHFYQ